MFIRTDDDRCREVVYLMQKVTARAIVRSEFCILCRTMVWVPDVPVFETKTSERDDSGIFWLHL